ncbi:MAG: SCP2 sterol-binding domain-containing protein [Candidatus Symbiodolus clandestinus]
MLPLLAIVLEKLLNHWVQTNSSLAPQLRQLSGSRVQLSFTELSSVFTLVVNDGNWSITLMPSATPAHCRVTTQLALLPRLRDPNQIMPLIRGGELAIEGDILLLQRLVSLLGALQWDIEEQLSRHVGDIASHAILRPMRWAKRLLGQQARQQRAWCRELLVEVWRWLPSRAEAQALTQALTQLQQQRCLLASRLQRLSMHPIPSIRSVNHDTVK